MSARSDRSFELPRPARGHWWPWLLAALAHVPVVLIFVSARRHYDFPTVEVHSVALGGTAPVVAMQFIRSRRRSPAPIGAVATVPVAASPAASAAPPPAVATPRIVPDAVSPMAVTRPVPATPLDSPPGGGSLIRPRYGDGRLWVQPLVASPREIASALTGKSRAELADSAVASIIQTYLDQMAKEQSESPSALPSWTTKIAGKTVGIDQRWIYLGPIKVPTALLALLPIRVQANPTQAQFNARLQQMRADLFEAARRAENYEEFKKAVKELHQETERKREFQRNQRTRPDTGGHG